MNTYDNELRDAIEGLLDVVGLIDTVNSEEVVDQLVDQAILVADLL